MATYGAAYVTQEDWIMPKFDGTYNRGAPRLPSNPAPKMPKVTTGTMQSMTSMAMSKRKEVGKRA